MYDSFQAKLPTSYGEVLNISVPDEKSKDEARNTNSLTVAIISMSCGTDELMVLISVNMPKDWPEDKAYEIWKSMKESCQPDD